MCLHPRGSRVFDIAELGFAAQLTTVPCHLLQNSRPGEWGTVEQRGAAGASLQLAPSCDGRKMCSTGLPANTDARRCCTLACQGQVELGLAGRAPWPAHVGLPGRPLAWSLHPLEYQKLSCVPYLRCCQALFFLHPVPVSCSSLFCRLLVAG